MPTRVHEFDWPDRVVVGTVGVPGARTFYLQARAGGQVASVVLEKEQSAVLAVMLDRLLDELMAEDGNPFSVAAQAPALLLDDEPLDEPLGEQFRAGSMRLAWDPTTAQVVLEAFPATADDEELGADDEPGRTAEEVLRIRMPVGTARAFAHRARRVVGEGRPICPRCGQPMDPGHVCVPEEDR